MYQNWVYFLRLVSLEHKWDETAGYFLYLSNKIQIPV